MKNVKLKNNLKRIRTEKNISLEDLAAKVNISVKELQKIESNGSNPSIIVSMKIARSLGMQVEDIFTINE